MPELKIRRLGYALGAEVRGVDLTVRQDDETIAAIRSAWLEHLLLCFPGQNLTREEQLAFASRFGELDTSGRINLSSPHVTLVTEKPVDGKPWNGYKDGQVWHTDKSFTLHPVKFSFLNCKEMPEVGGNTIWANQYMAYESLSPTMQTMLEGMDAIHDYELRVRSQPPSVTGGKSAEELKHAGDEHAKALRGGIPIPTAHPVVRVHPETARKALYLGRRVRGFAGMTDEESRPLLDFLNEHAVRYEFQYRHGWHIDDLVMWDNRCLLHIALSDYRLGVDARYMVKCAIKGDRSGYAYGDDAASAKLAEAGAGAAG